MRVPIISIVLLLAGASCGRGSTSQPSSPPSEAALSVLMDDGGRCAWRFLDPLRGIDVELARLGNGCSNAAVAWRFDGREAAVWTENAPGGPDPLYGPPFYAPGGPAEVWLVDLAGRTMRAIRAPPGAPRFLAYDARGDLLAVYYGSSSPGPLATFFGPWFGNPPTPKVELQLRRWTGRAWRSTRGGFEIDRGPKQFAEFAATLSPRSDASHVMGVSAAPHTRPFLPPTGHSVTRWERFQLESDPSRAVLTEQIPWFHGTGHSPPAYFVDAGGYVPIALSGTDGGIGISARGDLVLVEHRRRTGRENLLFRFGTPAPIAIIGTGASVTFWPVTDAAVLGSP